jgi:hypothetical protein
VLSSGYNWILFLTAISWYLTVWVLYHPLWISSHIILECTGKKFLPNNFFPWASTIKLFTVIINLICFSIILACITHKSLGLHSQQLNFFETCKWLREARVLYYTRLVCIAIVKRSSFLGPFVSFKYYSIFTTLNCHRNLRWVPYAGVMPRLERLARDKH